MMITTEERVVQEKYRTLFMNKLRYERSLKTARSMGKEYKVNPMTIQRWLRGEFQIDEIPLKTYRKVMGDDFLLGIGVAERERRPRGVIGDTPEERGMVPVYTGDSRSLAALFNELGQPTGDTDDYIECPPDLLDEQWIYGIRIPAGDLSMAPMLRPGNVAVVRPSAVPQDGDVVVARLGATQEVVVRIMERQGEMILLRAVNPSFGASTYPADAITWMRPVVWVNLKARN